jgi:chaperonin GroEL
LALATGGTFVSRESGKSLKDVKLKDLGRAQSLNVSKISTTIVGGDGNSAEIEKKIDSLKAEIEQADTDQSAEFLAQRVTRLASGVAIIKVGAATEVEMIEKKHRIEDALEAVRAAQTEGIVPGGGIALLRALRGAQIDVDSHDQRMGATLVLDAVSAPIRQMAKNAAVSPDIVLSVVTQDDLGTNMGYNFATDEVVNMFDEGIIDPVKVTRTALANAASVAAALITTNHAIVETE